MEITLLNKTTLRIKNKHASFVVNPQEASDANAALMLDDDIQSPTGDEAVVLQGAGEYEIGGVKITGIRNEKTIAYSMSLEGVEVIVGDIQSLTALQHKMKEHNIVVVRCAEVANASFLTSLAVNVVLFYGEKAEEVAQGFEKEKLQRMSKYSVSAGKLPTEVETIVLQ